MLTLSNFINGRFAPPVTGAYLDVFEPATGGVYAKAPDSSADDVNLAVGVAKAAFPGWAATPAEERSRIFLKLADLLEERQDEFARAESKDTGKPISLASTADIPRAIANFTCSMICL